MFLLNNLTGGGSSGSGKGGGGFGNVLSGALKSVTGPGGQGGGGGGGAMGNIMGALGGLAGQGGGGGGGGIGNIIGAIGGMAGSGSGSGQSRSSSGGGGGGGGAGGLSNIIGAIGGMAGSGQGGGGAGQFIQGAINTLSGGGGGGGQAGKLFAGGGGAGGQGQGMNILGGIVGLIGNVIANYRPEPPPVPCANPQQLEANENDEQRRFRQLFRQLAGEDMEVSPAELQNVLNKVVAKHQDLKTEGFSIDTCRSMVAVMDSDGTGKLGFEEFKYLWTNIKKWQCIYKQYDTARTGYIPASSMPAAVQAAGFQLNEPLQELLIRRYADPDGNVNFDSFISSLVRMDCMFRAFHALDRDNDGQVQIRLPDWLKLTVYS